jgi:membrane associated rhomboid family serine protease
MIPLRDVIPSRTTPWVTLSLIGLNALVFGYTASLSTTQHQDLLFAAGLVPADFTWFAVLTSMFVQSGWLHISGNLLALWIFGGTVEDRMGHARFLAFYLIAGLDAALAWTWAAPASAMPLVGAGGAIAGVLGAYFLEFPRSKVLVLVPIVFVYWEVLEVPATLILGLWLLLQVLGGFTAPVVTGGLTIWPLIGGVAVGLVGSRILQRRERRRVEWWSP